MLMEEMRRIVEFLLWKASWWREQKNARREVPDDLADGLAAYAAKQEDVNRSLATSFAVKWHPLLVSNNLSVNWPLFYVPPTLTHSTDSHRQSKGDTDVDLEYEQDTDMDLEYSDDM